MMRCSSVIQRGALSAGAPHAVLASTPGSVKPIFLSVSKSMVLRGLAECDYRQEQRPFQGRLLPLRLLG
jgi:hypothetical protein